MSKNTITYPVVNYAGEKVRDTELPAEVFDAEIREYAVQMAVRCDLAGRRLGTAHTLDRSVVHGSNRKPFRQKGTGRARAGTTNSPVWRHGGVVHGPEGNVNHSIKMNKREHAYALLSVLTEKAQTNNLIVLAEENFTSAKTKDFVAALKNIKADEKKNLIVLSSIDENLIKAAGNVQNVILTTADNISVYDVLNANKLIIFEGLFACGCDCDEECHCGCCGNCENEEAE